MQGLLDREGRVAALTGNGEGAAGTAELVGVAGIADIAGTSALVVTEAGTRALSCWRTDSGTSLSEDTTCAIALRAS